MFVLVIFVNVRRATTASSRCDFVRLSGRRKPAAHVDARVHVANILRRNWTRADTLYMFMSTIAHV